MSILTEKKFPEGFYWGAPVQWTGARPCLVFSEYLEESTDKVYSLCKRQLTI